MNDKSTVRTIHAELRERILLLDLKPGDPMREVRLSQHFGVSRTPIRQVLHRLEFEGLVDIGEARGARVSGLDPKTLRDTWAVRLRLAHLVGDFVSLPASAETIERLREIRASLAGVMATQDFKELGRLYNRFHDAVLEVVDNKTLRRIHDLLYVQTARVWMQFLPEMDFENEVEIMAQEVDQVSAALQGRSGAELSNVRAEHMSRLLNRFNQHISTIPAGPV